jgi:serine/threonine protein kinase
VNCKNNDVIEYKNIIRELQLLTQFSEIDKNIFTTKLHDVIIIQEEKSAKIKGIFFVMEYMPNDLKKMIQDNNPLHFTEQHIKVILYNLLCSLNFIHTSNVMHRDIKPANILIDMKCTVKICDFGLARTVVPPTVSSQDKYKRSLSSHISTRWYRSPEVILTQRYN